MKKIIFLLLTVISLHAEAQVLTPPSGYGKKEARLKALNYLGIPVVDTICNLVENTGNGTCDGGIVLRPADGLIYVHTAGYWKNVGPSIYIDSVRRSNDTLYFRKKPSGEIAVSISNSWSEITGKPSTFPPSAHTHVAADVTDFTTTVRSDISAAAPITYNSSTGAIGWNGNTSNVPEGMNLYFSNARVQSYSDTRYTPLTRELSIGTGMTGGGDLSADRSFGLDFSYLDDRYLSGYKQRAAVRVATTANITLSGLQTIDGVSVAAGDRVLVKNQTSGAQNGIYNAATGSWTRATDFDAVSVDEVAQGSQIFVSEGTVNNKTGWSLATGGTIVLNTTPLTFIQYSGANSYAAGTGLTLTGNSFSAQTTANLWNANKLQNTNITTTAPTSGQLLRYDGTNWAPWTSNYLTGELDVIAQSKTVSLTAGAGISVTGGAQTVGNNPAFTVTNTGTLANTLNNGNAANNAVILGSSGNTFYYPFRSLRTVSGVDYISDFSTSIVGAAIMSSMGGGATQRQFEVSTSQTAPRYSFDGGTTFYTMWHSLNHPAGSAFTPTLTGANVLASLTTNSAGHVTALTTRALTATDIGAAPASGSGNYIQNQLSSPQTAAFFINGTAAASVIKTNQLNGNIEWTIYKAGSSLANADRRWSVYKLGTESTENVGSDFNIGRYSDAGTYLSSPIVINRATGMVTMSTGFRAGPSSGIVGTGTTTNNSTLGFYQSDAATRDGYIGLVNKNAYLISDAGQVALRAGTAAADQLVVGPNTVNVASGLLNLTNSTSNFLQFPGVGLSTPSFASRSVGTRIVLSPNLGPSSTDYAIGMESSNMWFSASGSGGGFKWYAGTANIANLRGTGDFELAGQVRARGWSTAGTGAGLEMGVNTGAAGIQAYDRTAGQYLPLNISAGDGAVGQNFIIDNAYHFNIAGTEAVTISQGILSVGNNSPSTIRASPLQVQGNAWATDAWILGTGTTPTAEFGLTGTNSAFIRTMGTGDINFQTSAGTVRAKVNGTTGNFEVNNQIKISGGSPGAGKVLTSDGSGLASWSFQKTRGVRTSISNTIAIAATDDLIACIENGQGTITATLPPSPTAGMTFTILTDAYEIVLKDAAGTVVKNIAATYSATVTYTGGTLGWRVTSYTPSL